MLPNLEAGNHAALAVVVCGPCCQEPPRQMGLVAPLKHILGVNTHHWQ